MCAKLAYLWQGLVGLVTGGASGLGRATVQRLVKDGGRVVICDLPTSTGQQVASELGDNALFMPTDVRKRGMGTVVVGQDLVMSG